MEALGEQSNLIVKSKLEDFKDTGGFFDSNMRVLAYFRHEHTWRTPRGPIRIAKQARATDIYLESFNGNLFGEINEIPPKLISMKLIRTFEIYNDKKELVGVVREKPKAIGSDWVLENVEEKAIAIMVGDRKKKDYEIQTPDGEFLARCFRDFSLDKYSYRLERRIVGGGVDLFLLLCYIVVLDLAKTGWATREGLFFSQKEEKDHLLKTQAAKTPRVKTQASEPISVYAIRNACLSVAQAAIVFTLATMFLETNSSFPMIFLFGPQFLSIILYVFGVAILVTALIGLTLIKLNRVNPVAMLMGFFAALSFFIGFIMFQGGFGLLTFELTILVVAMLIVGFGILVNLWLMIGLFDDFVKKKKRDVQLQF